MPAAGSPVFSITRGCFWGSATPYCAKPIAKPSKRFSITICCDGNGVAENLRGGVVERWKGGGRGRGLAPKKRTQKLCNSLVSSFGFRSQWATDSRGNY